MEKKILQKKLKPSFNIVLSELKTGFGKENVGQKTVEVLKNRGELVSNHKKKVAGGAKGKNKTVKCSVFSSSEDSSSLDSKSVTGDEERQLKKVCVQIFRKKRQ